jgi:thioredoxin-dependent peroxiredoxin
MALPAIGKKAPVFKGVDQNGKKLSLTDFKGQKVHMIIPPPVLFRHVTCGIIMLY